MITQWESQLRTNLEDPVYSNVLDRAISSTMQGYFATFVKAGDPNAAGLPRWSPALPTSDAATRQVIDVNTRSEPFTFQASYPQAVTLLDGGSR